MEIIRSLYTVCALTLLVGCGTSHLAFRPDDKRMTPEAKAESIPLFLPRTVLEFRCTGAVKATEPSQLLMKARDGGGNFTADQVAKEAEKLGIKLNTNEVKVIEYSINDSALTARGERDPEALFFIKMNSGLFKKVELNAQFSSDGVPGSVSSTVENKAFEFTMKTIEVAASIAGKAIGAAILALDETGLQPSEMAKTNLLEPVVEQIKAVRAEKELLVSGRALSAQVDEKTFARMVDELTKLETGLAACFKGASKEDSYPLVCTIRPGRTPQESFEMFAFGEKTGFKANQDSETIRLSSLPNELQTTNSCPSKVLLSLSKPSDLEVKALQQIASAKATDRGLPYRIPVRTFGEVKIAGSKDSESLIKGEVLLAQWGEVTHLPPSVGSPGSTFKPIYYTETGGLKELTVTGTPLSADSLSSLDKATGSITDALKSKADKEASAAKDNAAKEDELNVLKREADILEQKLRIQGLQEKLPSTSAGSSP